MPIILNKEHINPTFICKPFNTQSVYPYTNPLHCYINKCMFDSINVCCICNRNICTHHSTSIDNTNVTICWICKKNPSNTDLILTTQYYYSKPSYITQYVNKLLEFINILWIFKSNKIKPCLIR